MSMQQMARISWIGALAALAVVSSVQAQAPDSVTALLWLDRGSEPVVEIGDEVRVYYRTNIDAFAAIFRVDTKGNASLVFPQHPDADAFVAAGRDHRLLFPESARWRVGDDVGLGHFVIIASQSPLDLSTFEQVDGTGWDLETAGAGRYEDVYLAVDDFVTAVLPAWEQERFGLNLVTYEVVNAEVRDVRPMYAYARPRVVFTGPRYPVRHYHVGPRRVLYRPRPTIVVPVHYAAGRPVYKERAVAGSSTLSAPVKATGVVGRSTRVRSVR
jgi:hypothetical protein